MVNLFLPARKKKSNLSLVNGRILPCTSSYLTVGWPRGYWPPIIPYGDSLYGRSLKLVIFSDPPAGYAPRKSTQLGKNMFICHIYMLFLWKWFYVIFLRLFYAGFFGDWLYVTLLVWKRWIFLTMPWPSKTEDNESMRYHFWTKPFYPISIKYNHGDL